ncbi:hypothetical protein [Microcoleus sp. herbarium14]|uniref:hypothetical protein n=1 Tax=Microcoleus sp. herbarium14 TaxID=3055439 RepID=UPI002FD3561C
MTITASKSNSSTEGNNTTSSNSSDTSRTGNSQTVTTHKDGRKEENGSSTYEKWLRDSSYDSKGVVSDVYKYYSWTSSYSKNYFKGGYSWTETLSGYDSESATKRAVYTSSGSSWSWTRSGTVWDDGRNDWSESWSKSSWKDGKYAPSESESKRGGFDPKKTTPQVNDVPKFGEPPRLNKAPKGKDVPPDLSQINKPSKNILTSLPRRTPPPENAPDNWVAGPPGGGGGGGGKLPPNKISALTKVIKQLLNFFRPLGEFVAGAVYQWLRNNGESARWLLQVLIPGWNGLEQDVERGLPQTWTFKAGRTFGDGAAIVTGILEIIGGGGAAGGGGSLCVTGFGCIAGAPAIVAGTALGLHGAATTSRGLANILADIAENLGVVFQSSSGSNGGGRSYEPPASSRQTYDGDTMVQWRTTPNDSRPAVVTFKEVNPGVIEVSEIFSRDLPKGSGGRMIADALRTNRINRPSTVRFTNITNTPTLEAIEKGVAPQDTLLGNTLKNAVREMGGTPTSWNIGTNARGQVWIEVKVSY